MPLSRATNVAYSHFFWKKERNMSWCNRSMLCIVALGLLSQIFPRSFRRYQPLSITDALVRRFLTRLSFQSPLPMFPFFVNSDKLMYVIHSGCFKKVLERREVVVLPFSLFRAICAWTLSVSPTLILDNAYDNNEQCLPSRSFRLRILPPLSSLKIQVSNFPGDNDLCYMWIRIVK